jgi:selenocysteine-specific elongation factor
LLKEHFERDRLSLGLGKAEAIERLFPGRAAELAPVYLDWLAAQKKIVIAGGRINPPGRGAELTGEESSLAAAVLARFEQGGLAPPAPGELRAALAAKPQILDGVVRFLVERGKLLRLPDGLVIAAAAVERLKHDLAATGWERFSVPQFKERFGLSRKWAIPLLEHLDARGATRRVGDERLVLR